MVKYGVLFEVRTELLNSIYIRRASSSKGKTRPVTALAWKDWVSEKRTAVRGDQDSNPALPAGIQDRQLIIMTKSTHLYWISHSRFDSAQRAVQLPRTTQVLLTARGTHSYYTCSVVVTLAFSSTCYPCSHLPMLPRNSRPFVKPRGSLLYLQDTMWGRWTQSTLLS
jgi:hypothetical protein